MILQLDSFTFATGFTLVIATALYLYKRKNIRMMYTKTIDDLGTRVCSMNPNNEIHVNPNEITVIDQLLQNMKECPDKNFLGMHSSPTDPYTWITYSKFIDQVKELGSGIDHILSKESCKFVGIYGKTCYQWVLSQYSLAFYSRIISPLYDTLGEQAREYIINHVEISCCVCYDISLARKILSNKNCDRVQYFLFMRNDDLSEIRNEYPLKKFYTLEEVQKIGKENPKEFKLPAVEDTFMLNFTSGSTGNPKGVIITHDMVMKTISSVYRLKNFVTFPRNDPRCIYLTEDDVYFSFLPLAHILEQMMTCICIYSKSSIGYYSGDIQKIIDEIGILKPTVIVLVPRLLHRIYNGAKEKVADSKIKSQLFFGALKLGKSLNDSGLSAKFLSRTIFNTLRVKFGGRVKLVITGSAPCPAEVTQFIRIALGAAFHNGYGLSETCGPVSLTFRDDLDNGTAGAPICCIAIRLKDVPEEDLIVARDKRGEICVKGPSCTPGYYKDDANNKNLFDSAGWLRTGDVGMWDDKGRIVIVDRVKNLFKTSHGEYVSPEKLESVYSSVPIIEQVVIDCKESRIFSLIYPSKVNLRKHLDSDLVDSNLNESVAVKDLFKKECNLKAKEAGLTGFERLDLIYFMDKPIELDKEGLLTPTLKYVRRKIREKFKDEMEQTYQKDLQLQATKSS